MTSLQQIFDQVSNHLLNQNRASLRLFTNYYGDLEMQGAYRGDDNTKCSGGCLINDENYTEALEGQSVLDKDIFDAITKSIGPFDKCPRALIQRLQNIHDYWPPRIWQKLLLKTAKEFNLVVNFES